MDRSSRIIVVALGLLAAIAVVLWSTRTQPVAPAEQPTTAPSTQPSPDRTTTLPAPARVPATAVDPVEVDTTPANAGTPWMRVRVTDPQGPPIAGATVETFADSTPGQVASDADGWCTIPVRAEGQQMIRLAARFGDRHWQTISQRLDTVTIPLPWAGPLRGRLVDDRSGLAVSGATVTMSHGNCLSCARTTAVSAAGGSFVIDAVPRNDNVTIAFAVDGFPQQGFLLRFPGRGEPVEHTFRLRHGAAVAGRCVDLDSRQPLAGASLTIGGDGVGTTATDGGFRILVLPDREGHVELTLAAADHLRVSFDLQAPQPDASREYALPRAVSLGGTVRDPNGSPIEGADVWVSRDFAAGAHPPALPGMPTHTAFTVTENRARVITDQVGRYRQSGLIPDQRYRLMARHAGYQPASGSAHRGVPAIAGANDADVDLVLVRLTAFGTIVGRYTLNGTPTGGSIRWKGSEDRGGTQIRTDGSFRIEAVEPGAVTLSATAFSLLGEEWSLRQQVEVEAGKELRIHLDQQMEQQSVTGHVRYPDGAPAAGHSIGIHDALRLATTVQGDGSYELLVPRGFPSLLGVQPAGTADRREVWAGASGVDFVVPRRQTFRYRALAGDSGQTIDSRWAIRRDGTNHFWPLDAHLAPGTDGFRTATLPGGNHLFLASARGYGTAVQAPPPGPAEATLEVWLPREVPVVLRLAADADPPPAELRVALIDEAFGAARGALQSAIMLGLERSLDLATGGTLRDVGPGHHRLEASDARYEIVPDAIDVVAGTAPVIELHWREKPK